MANKVTPSDIAQFNKLYYELKTYAAVARATGFSSSTVSKYVDKNWRPVDETKIKRVTMADVPPFSTHLFKGLENFGQLCIYSVDEKYEVEEFWNELEQ